MVTQTKAYTNQCPYAHEEWMESPIRKSTLRAKTGVQIYWWTVSELRERIEMPNVPKWGRLLLLRAYREYTGAGVSCKEPKERKDACKVREHEHECECKRERGWVLQVLKCYGSSGDATGWWKILAVNPKIILLLFTGLGQIWHDF